MNGSRIIAPGDKRPRLSSASFNRHQARFQPYGGYLPIRNTDSQLCHTKVPLRSDFWKVARQRPVPGSAPALRAVGYEPEAAGAVGCAPRPDIGNFERPMAGYFFQSPPE